MKQLLATVAVLALFSAAPVRAEEPSMMDNVKIGFGQAIKDIQTWFGKDTPDTVEPAAGEEGFTVTEQDDMLQVPPPVDPSLVEPAAGAFDDDTLQVPPPYLGPDANDTNTDPTAQPRASAFDGNQSNLAFGDQPQEDLNAIAPASGTDATAPALDCVAITASVDAGEDVEASLVEQCKNPASVPVASDAATITPTTIEPAKAPAQPAFEITPIPSEPAVAPSVTPEPLPETEPATGQ